MPDGARPHVLTDEHGDIGDLLELAARRPAWQADGACREHPELNWFPERGQDTRPAKAVCAGCLVMGECRQWALDQGPELAGIWGALSQEQRTVARRALPPDQRPDRRIRDPAAGTRRDALQDQALALSEAGMTWHQIARQLGFPKPAAAWHAAQAAKRRAA